MSLETDLESEVEYVMAHCQPMTKGSLKRVLREEWRELKSYKNNVDRSRTDTNYSMRGRSPEQILELLDNRCKEVMQGRKMQKQTNVAFSWVISTPVPLKGNEDKTKQFFSAVYDFLEERYGKDNVLEGMVHMDEDNPHMHATIVSEAVSRKTGKRTISAASVITRSELKAFHTDLDKHIENVMGVKGLVKNGRTVGNLSLPEYKTVMKEKTRNIIKETELEQREKDVNDKLVKVDELTRSYTSQVRDLSSKVSECNKRDSELTRREADLQGEKERLKQREAEFDEKWSKLTDLSNLVCKRLERVKELSKGIKYSDTEYTNAMMIIYNKNAFVKDGGKLIPASKEFDRLMDMDNRLEQKVEGMSFENIYDNYYGV